VQTSPALRDISNHSVRQMLAHKRSLTFCTDNRLVSRTSVVRELTLALSWSGAMSKFSSISLTSGRPRPI